MKRYSVVITLESPLHLGTGHADVIVDAEAARDEFGMPIFPGKRLKGLLYESALELAEISSNGLFSKSDVEKLFAQSKDENVIESAVRIENFHLPNYEKMCDGWEYLRKRYSGLFTRNEVWESYSELRTQVSIDSQTGAAKEGALRNIRAVDAGLIFVGNIILVESTPINEKIIKYALLNLRYAGAKRNRGFGRIKCTIQGE